MDEFPKLGQRGRILEGLVTTLNEDGTVNLAPMGPIVDETFHVFVMRPFQMSTTYRNLCRSRECVFHVCDDVLLLAQAAVGQPDIMPEMFAAEAIQGRILSSACRWYELSVHEIDNREARAVVVSRRIHQGKLRDCFGFNRAKHAVLEAAILATRVDFLPAEHLTEEMQRLRPLVEKTGARAEREAFEFLQQYIDAAPATEANR